MAVTLSLSSTVEVFPCPNCGETINTSLELCPFCAKPVDHVAARVAATETSRISQACSDASYLKIMAWMLLTFVVVMFVPFVGLAGLVGLWFLRFAIPVMVVRWWIRYGKIRTDDLDFVRAKRAAVVISIVAVLVLANAFLNLT